MEFRIALSLPRDAVSVPVARKMCQEAMSVLGVRDDCAHDISVALTEACTNVLDHATDEDDYTISLSVGRQLCVIEVTDGGAGFDADAVGREIAASDAESGRGVHLMRMLVDRVRFTSRPEDGTLVHLEKELAWQEGGPRLG